MELNTPSQKVLLNNKFKKEGVLKNNLFIKIKDMMNIIMDYQ
jgi:hypothetical protein